MGSLMKLKDGENGPDGLPAAHGVLHLLQPVDMAKLTHMEHEYMCGPAHSLSQAHQAMSGLCKLGTVRLVVLLNLACDAEVQQMAIRNSKRGQLVAVSCKAAAQNIVMNMAADSGHINHMCVQANRGGGRSV